MTKELDISRVTCNNTADSKPLISPWPVFEKDEIDAVSNVLQSGKVNYWTGSLTRNFEHNFATYHNRNYGIALANGTLALELALIVMGIGPGDEVISTCRTFIASASCIVRVGATPIMADIDPASQNVTVDTLTKALSPKCKALIVVHLAGWPCDMPAIMKFAEAHGLKVIEDCAQSHGAKIDGHLTGSFGHMAAFSFCQDKIMTTGGEGGMLLLDDKELYEKAWAFKDHGKSYEAVYRKTHPPGFRWLHESFGTNWRLTEMQAAIGLLQLSKLEKWVEKRRLLAHRLIEKIQDCRALQIPVPNSRVYHSYYKFYCFIRPELLKAEWSREKIMEFISNSGYPCFSGSCGEIYLEKAFETENLRPNDRFLNASLLSETSLMFLVHPTLDENYIDALAELIVTTMALASR